jgi:hypothetical protein
MKKFLLTTVFSLSLLATPAWGVWYTEKDDPLEVDTDRGTITVKIRDVNIYFKATKGSKVLQGDDDDKVDEIENLLKGKKKDEFTVTFIKPTKNEHLSLMAATLIKFEWTYENIRCYEATPGIKTAWDELYQKTKRQIDRANDDKQERRRANQDDYENFLESNGPGVEIMKAMGYFSESDSDGDGSYSDSDRTESFEEDYDDYV